MPCLQGLREPRSTGRYRVARAAVVGAAIAIVLTGVVPAPANAQDLSRGATLLGEARTAIGGAERLEGVTTLQVTGTFRRVVDGNDTEGDFDVFIELPDKYLRSEKTGTPGQPSTETIEALVGAQVRDAVLGGGGGRGGGGGALAGGDGFPPGNVGDDSDAGGRDEGLGDAKPAEADAAAGPATGPGNRGGDDLGAEPDALRQARQADVSRLLLMWLLRSEMPLAWVGIAESPDGKADVVEARYEDGRPTRLFLEANTHMPLMMQWETAPVPVGGARGRLGGGGRRGGGGQDVGPTDGAGARQGSSPPTVTSQMTFFDHRAVNGIRLPYVITRGANGQTTERWTISRYRVNQSFPVDTFTR